MNIREKGGGFMRIAASNVNLSSSRNYQQYRAVYEKEGFEQNLINLGEKVAVRQRDIYESKTEQCTNCDTLDQSGNYSDISSYKTENLHNQTQEDKSSDLLTTMQINLLQAILKMFDEMYSGKMLSFRNSLQSELTGLQGGNISELFVTQSTAIEAEQESTSFEGTGKAYTEDGRVIDFGVSIGMSRSFARYTQISTVQQSILEDPLVINVASSVTQISDQKFMFDLNCDGEEEKISKLCSGSGFLTLDKNGNGKADDGSELFGAQSGNGFKDLQQYDGDGNGWIDENDKIWNELKVWMKNEDGTDKMLSMKDAGVGAIFLGETGTEFAQKGNDGETDAVIRSTGLFLHENGGTGTIQQVDFAVSQGKSAQVT